MIKRRSGSLINIFSPRGKKQAITSITSQRCRLELRLELRLKLWPGRLNLIIVHIDNFCLYLSDYPVTIYWNPCMRFIFTLTLFIALIGTTSSAQAEHGAYAAAVVKNGSIARQNSILAGGRAGWQLSGSFFLGGAFYGLVNTVETNTVDPLNGRRLIAGFNCGGLEIEYLYPSKSFLHGSFLFFMGGGGIKPKAQDSSIPHTGYYGQSLLIWEPQLSLEADLTRLLHLGLGLSYRYVTGTDGYIGLQNKDLSSLNSIITLRLGVL